MIRRKPFHAPPAKVQRFGEYTIGRRTLNTGDLCKVTGHRGVFEFLAHCSNTETGDEWLDVKGPMHNPRHRSVRPERVKPLPRRRKR